jgi:TctA family transporter
MEFYLWLLAGTLYGLLIGLVPVAGATTGLVAVFSFIHVFVAADPYAGVAFTTALVAASALGDSFASVVMNIPGANGSAATMVDGFPLARRGEAAYALSAAITTSTVNGLIWGALVFLLLPYYADVVMLLGIPEIWALMVVALCCMVFVNNRYWVRGFMALALGIFLGLVGTDPATNSPRFTGGWFYLADGVQMVTLLAGVLAIPELLDGLRRAGEPVRLNAGTQWLQIRAGIKASWQHRWLGLQGGAIGAVIGALPGLAGAIADWLAYAVTVAANKKERVPFGQGNIKGVIGCEGANNSHKATAYLPTVLFGIPGAPFAAVLIGLFMFLGFEMGSTSLLSDQRFFDSLGLGYFLALLITFPVAIIGIRWLTMITVMPFQWFFWPVLAVIVWTSVQYTGGWEDYAVLCLATVLGLACRHWRFSRPALVIGFVLADKLEAMTLQLTALYTWPQLMSRPGFVIVAMVGLLVLVYGIFFFRSRIDFV